MPLGRIFQERTREMQVLKFGGSSVANATRISRVLDIVEQKAREDRVIVICSAISGCTDQLIAMGQVEGERRESLLAPLKQQHYDIVSRLFTGVERNAVKAELDILFEELLTVPGDECQTYGELISTRIIARKLACEGLSTLWIDSRSVVIKDNEARTYSKIASAVGSHREVRVFVAPGFIAGDGYGHVTNLGRGGSDYSAALFAAAVKADSLEIWTDVPGIMTANPKDVPSARTIPAMSYASALCMAQHGAKVLYAPTVLPAMEAGIGIRIRNTFDLRSNGTFISDLPSPELCEWVGVSSLSVGDDERIFLVADGPMDSVSANARAMSALRNAGVSALCMGEGSGFVYFDVRRAIARQALSAIHREFFEVPRLTKLDVYIAGRGAVGNALYELISTGIARESGKELNIAGFSSDHGFADTVIAHAARHSVFVDCTDSEDIYKKYIPLLEAGIDIVSSNRRSLAVPFVEYSAMRQAAMRNGCFLRYGTTVGTSLPMLQTISRSKASSDRITSIEAVVSCTLNYILSSGRPFNAALRQAQEIGLTEKDPSHDLGGRDALRKLLILSREAGVPLEAEDVEIEPVNPDSVYESNQRFVASLDEDSSSPLGYKASIRLKTVPENHPAYWLQGTDNAIIIRSVFHPSPLVIQGAGEGAQQAAASILNDILK